MSKRKITASDLIFWTVILTFVGLAIDQIHAAEPPQWLIDLRASQTAKEIVKHVVIVDKPHSGVELPDPEVIGTEMITTPQGGEIEVDIIIEPEQPPAPIGFWDIKEESRVFVEGAWYKLMTGKDRYVDIWRPDHWVVTKGYYWTSLVFHGNVKSKSFHKPGCRYFDCNDCTEILNTREIAIENGYKPCGICKP